MDFIKSLENELVETKQYPDFKSGDTISVTYKIKEGNKERPQTFQGVVLQRKGSGATETFTIRKMSGNVGVERIFPVNSPFILTIGRPRSILELDGTAMKRRQLRIEVIGIAQKG